MSENNNVILDRNELEQTIKYLQAASNNIHHINHALFDSNYKTCLDLNNEHDVRNIRVTLFFSIASINREIQELESKIKKTDHPLQESR